MSIRLCSCQSCNRIVSVLLGTKTCFSRQRSGAEMKQSEARAMPELSSLPHCIRTTSTYANNCREQAISPLCAVCSPIFTILVAWLQPVDDVSWIPHHSLAQVASTRRGRCLLLV